jgi:hypothetical protein
VKGDETVLIFKHRRTVIFDELVLGPFDRQTGRLRVSGALLSDGPEEVARRGNSRVFKKSKWQRAIS